MLTYLLAPLLFLSFFGITTTETTISSEEPVTVETSAPAYTEVKTNANLDEFATCLKDREVTFYGAFWCPHCQDQKALFGKADELLPYVECSTPDGKDQTKICKDKEITTYPTWVFADGTIETGEHTLAELSGKTGCGLPENI